MLCLSDAIHNFKWTEIFQIWQKINVRFIFSMFESWYLMC